MGLYQRDYILRMIEAVGATLRRALKRRDEGDLAGARQDIALTIAEILGPSAGIAPLVASSTAVDLVSDPARIALYAQLLEADAELLAGLGDLARAAVVRQRALELLLEVVLRTPELPDEIIEQARALRARVEISGLAARYQSVALRSPSQG